MNKVEATEEIFRTPWSIQDNLDKYDMTEWKNKQREKMLEESSKSELKQRLQGKISRIDEAIINIAENNMLKPDKYLDRFDSMVKRTSFMMLEEWSDEYNQLETYFNIKREELERIVELKKEIIS